MKLRTPLPGIVAALVLCASAAMAQIRPATIDRATPAGAQRGTTVKITVDGVNLGGATAVLFDHDGLSARILSNEDRGADVVERPPDSVGPRITDRARKHQVVLEVSVAPGTPVGWHGFRLLTPLGTTNVGSLAIGALPEAIESEPNDTPAAAQELALPVTMNGRLEKEGDFDRYRFEAQAGQQLVFEVAAMRVGSALDPVLTLRDDSGLVLARNDDYGGRPDSLLAHRFPAAGRFVVEVKDAANGGGLRHFYRLTAGELPYVERVFPLGIRRGSAAPLKPEGFNLAAAPVTVDVTSVDPSKERVPVAVGAGRGEPLNRVEAVLGEHPELLEREPNDRKRPQLLSAPVTVNGRLDGAGGRDEDVFRFSARPGQTIVFSVMAARAGSPLDPVLEVLDLAGREIPRATLRPVWQTTVDLRDHDSTGNGIRLLSWSGLRAGDDVLIDRDLMRIRELPAHPDADTIFESFRGRRLAFQETTPEGHAYNAPVYKVEVHPPGADSPPNGMPIFTLACRNDDGGSGFGRDSRLTFTAPRAGDYLLRLRDSRGLAGPAFAYRLTAAEPRPDFKLYLGSAHPNVPRGGRIPVHVAVDRLDGFEGPVQVELADLPAGVAAEGVTVPPHSSAAVLTLAASDSAAVMTAAPFRVVARAEIAGRPVEREATAEAVLSRVTVVEPPDLYLASVEPREVDLPAGGRARLTVRIRRSNGFAGRVPVSVQNLPFGVHIPDFGLNGVLITEQEEAREFWLEAAAHAPPGEQRLFLTGRVEVNSGLPTEHASEPVVLRIVPAPAAASR